MQVEPVQDGAFALMPEAHSLKPDVPAGLQLDGMPRFEELRLGLEHLSDPAARGERLLQRRHALPEHPQRPDEHHHVGVEGDEGADGQLPGDHAAAAEPQHRGDPEQRQHLEHRDEDRVEPGECDRPVHDLVAAAAEARRERVARAEALDDADPADRLLDQGGGPSPGSLELPRAAVVLARIEPGPGGHERDRDQHDERELRVEHQHHDRDRDDRQRVADRVPDRVHHPRDVLGVGGGAAQQLARPDAVVIGGVEAQRVGEERVAHTGVGVRAVANRVQVAKGAGADLEQPDAEQQEEPEQQRVVIARDDPVVDRVLDDERSRDRSGLPEQAGAYGAYDAAPLLAHDGAHESPRRGAASL